ncbi:MAG: transposase, partial [Lysobacteraceae bacterium]
MDIRIVMSAGVSRRVCRTGFGLALSLALVAPQMASAGAVIAATKSRKAKPSAQPKRARAKTAKVVAPPLVLPPQSEPASRMIAWIAAEHDNGGLPYVVIDNLKSGVKNAHRYDPDLNPTYCDYGNQCGFAVLPARPYTPRDKACIEATIGVFQRSLFQSIREQVFYDLWQLNDRCLNYVVELNSSVMKDYGISRDERF